MQLVHLDGQGMTWIVHLTYLIGKGCSKIAVKRPGSPWSPLEIFRSSSRERTVDPKCTFAIPRQMPPLPVTIALYYLRACISCLSSFLISLSSVFLLWIFSLLRVPMAIRVLIFDCQWLRSLALAFPILSFNIYTYFDYHHVIATTAAVFVTANNHAGIFHAHVWTCQCKCPESIRLGRSG